MINAFLSAIGDGYSVGFSNTAYKAFVSAVDDIRWESGARVDVIKNPSTEHESVFSKIQLALDLDVLDEYDGVSGLGDELFSEQISQFRMSDVECEYDEEAAQETLVDTLYEAYDVLKYVYE